MRRSILFFSVALFTLTSCSSQYPYRAGNAATETFMADPKTCPELTTAARYTIPVAYLEIDDQGYFQDRGQIDRALAILGDPGKPKYVVVFVHGWFHNASRDDENVQRFKCALSNIQGIDDNAGEEVVGIYIGWRGESWTLPGIRYATFWDRKNTSDEVGRGSLVEFLTRLEREVKPSPNSPNKLMLIGHSFGASVVFNAIGQVLMVRFLLDVEKLASKREAPAHSQSRPGLVSGYGDLVVLVNPAIEAIRIMPFFSALNEYTAKQADLLSPAQPARLVLLSSEGDWATRITFPAARVFSTLLDQFDNDKPLTMPYEKPITLSQRYLARQTMANVPEIQTHRPLHESTRTWDGKCPPVDANWLPAAIEERKRQQRDNHQPETGAGWSKVFDGTTITLTHESRTTPSNPLWIMAVGTELIPSHTGIANPVLICLFNQLLGDPKIVNQRGRSHERDLRSK